MANYTAADAKKLYDELQEALKGIPAQIDRNADQEAIIGLICQALGKAISAIKPPHRS